VLWLTAAREGLVNYIWGEAITMLRFTQGGDDTLIAGTGNAGSTVINYMWGDAAVIFEHGERRPRHVPIQGQYCGGPDSWNQQLRRGFQPEPTRFS
jgi:hypothetical protein